MSARGTPIWRLAARMFFVPLFAWLLVAQSILLPLAKAQAAERAGISGVLAILCSPTLPVPGDTGDDAAVRQVHDFGSCTLAGRLDLDLPVASLAAPVALLVPVPPEQQAAYTRPPSRAPPAITATPASARAPPSRT